MSRPVARWIAARLMLVVLCWAVATVVGLVVSSTAGVRDEKAQGLIFAGIFVVALVAGLVRLPLDRRL
jgi:hypothetical protein